MMTREQNGWTTIGVVFAALFSCCLFAANGEETTAHFELLSVLRHDAVAGAHDIEVRGDFAYVAGKANKHLPGRAGRFAIVAVANPESLNVLSVLDEGDHTALFNAETVLLDGDVCYLGANDFLSVDISNPAAARIQSVVRHKDVDRINGMVKWADTVIAANKSGRLNAFDVSKPREPAYIGSIDTRRAGNLISPHDIARFGSQYVVVPSAGRDAPVHFGVYDVRRDGKTVLPPDEWRCVATVADERLLGANRVVADDRYAYVACHYSNRIGIIDLAIPAEPRLVTALPTCGVEPDGLALHDNVLFVGAGKTVEAIDVSTPTRPQSIACYKGGALFTKPEEGKAGNAHDLVVRGDLIYVTAQRDGAIGVLQFVRE